MNKIKNKDLGMINFGTISMKTLGVVFVILAFFAGPGVYNAAAVIPSAERNALIDFYNNTDGDHWTDNAGWLGAIGTECTWSGVGCDAGETHVTGLWRYSNNLVGTIPTSIGNLTYLQFLELYDNSLTGTIPAEIGNLTSLQDILLFSNNLSGAIPSELGNITNLGRLDVSKNQLSGTIPPELASLSNLFSLILQYNQISGTIPPELGNLSSLVDLALGRNQLSGAIPTQLGNLTLLTTLYLNNNQLTGTIPAELGNLSNLLFLLLQNNQLSGTIPVEIGYLTNLWFLGLNNNHLTGVIPTSLTSLTSLSSSFPNSLCFNALHATDSGLRAFLDANFNNNGTGSDWEGCQDSDFDNTMNSSDNCRLVANPDQADYDKDQYGSGDPDGGDACDNCPTVYNLAQTDTNGDDIGDACEAQYSGTIDVPPSPTLPEDAVVHVCFTFDEQGIAEGDPLPYYIIPPDCANVMFFLNDGTVDLTELDFFRAYKMNPVDDSVSPGDLVKPYDSQEYCVDCNLSELYHPEVFYVNPGDTRTFTGYAVYAWDIKDPEKDALGSCPLGAECYDVFTGAIKTDVNNVSIFRPKINVSIDIKPGDDLNEINTGSKGNIPVAIFGSASFDVSTVLPLSIRLNTASVKVKGKAETPQVSYSDVNEDGYQDMIIHVMTEELSLETGDVIAVLTGNTTNNEVIEGSDSIVIVK